jgi:hypothetical protein
MKRGTRIPSSWTGILAGTIAVAVTLCGCGIPDAIRGIDITAQHSVAVLNQGIHQISMESASWRVVLEDMQAQLVADAQSTLRHEVSALMQRGIGASECGIVCVTDAVPKRILQALEVLRAKQRGLPPPSMPPTLCFATPDWIDLNIETVRQPIIHYFGYDISDEFDDIMLSVRLENGRTITVESDLLSMVSDYELALNVSRINPFVLSRATHLILYSHRGTLSEIPVIKTLPKPKRTDTVSVGPTSMTYVPPFSDGGDEDFASHGPDVIIGVHFKFQNDGAFVQIYMRAGEICSDWTAAEGWSDWQKFYQPPAGWTISQCFSDLNFADFIKYRDDDTSDDVFTLPPLGIFRIVGDTDGDEAGTDTSVRIDFEYKLTLEIREL